MTSPPSGEYFTALPSRLSSAHLLQPTRVARDLDRTFGGLVSGRTSSVTLGNRTGECPEVHRLKDRGWTFGAHFGDVEQLASAAPRADSTIVVRCCADEPKASVYLSTTCSGYDHLCG